MGDAVRIADLARLMIRLAGLTERTPDRPEGDIAIEFTGLRPGEKLYEELLIGDDATETEHPMIMRASEAELPWSALRERLSELESACARRDAISIRRILAETVEGFDPDSEVADLVWRASPPEDTFAPPPASRP
jgi:FlaA1/EpsC-like NDP-sugar epimerase